MQSPARAPLIAIACGGTGGHLFAGVAVAEQLQDRGAEVLLLISGKEVDQRAARAAPGLATATLPAVALERGRWAAAARGFWASFRATRARFRARPPAAVLAMGGFTGGAPVLAGKLAGAATFLHEGNSIPGRANRWLAHWVDEAFVYFEEAAGRLWRQRIRVTGMPVRAAFEPLEAGPCRLALGLQPGKPVLLVTGGSQGARALNELMTRVLPTLALLDPDLQYVHLTGVHDLDPVRQAYAGLHRRALVRPFLTEMELALGAATVAVTRAGGASLAELAAMGVPAVLVPYPFATDNHQLYNARAFVATGAARLQEQRRATPETMLWELRGLLHSECARQALRAALRPWHFPAAAAVIAETLMRTISAKSGCGAVPSAPSRARLAPPCPRTDSPLPAESLAPLAAPLK